MEGSCSGAAEGLEIRAAPALLSSSGHSGRLALPSGQRGLPASVHDCGTTTGDKQRLPLQAEVRSQVIKVAILIKVFFIQGKVQFKECNFDGFQML